MVWLDIYLLVQGQMQRADQERYAAHTNNHVQRVTAMNITQQLLESAKQIIADHKESSAQFAGMPTQIRNSSIESLRAAIAAAEKQEPTDEAAIAAIFLEAQRAYDRVQVQYRVCKECDGSGRETDSTPCSNPNEAANCIGCRGRGSHEIPLGLYDRLNAAFDVIRPHLAASLTDIGKIDLRAEGEGKQ